MSHLPLSFMNGLNQTLSFKFWMLYFQTEDFFSDYLRQSHSFFSLTRKEREISSSFFFFF